MRHLTDEEMMEQIYGESENTAAVERHLAACPECASGFAELKRDLAAVSGAMDGAEAPARDAGYGERVWATIAPMLPAYAVARPRWWQSAVLARGLSYAAAAALLLSCAFYAGRLWEQKKQTDVARMPSQPPRQKQPIVMVVLDDHLDRSERFLVELKHADFDSADIDSPMRDEAKSLLAANRVCRKNAAQADDPDLTTALDHLDKLLGEATGELNAATIARLQQEMNSDGVLFEVRVLRSRRARPAGGAAQGGTI